MAALNSAFNPAGGGKGAAEPRGSSGASQRRAAVAALSGVIADPKIDEPSPVASPGSQTYDYKFLVFRSNTTT